MNQEWHIQSGKYRERGAEIVFADVLEFRDTGRNEETFKSERTSPIQCMQFARIARDDAAPEAHVYPAFLVRRNSLRFERGRRGRSRNTVERHVDQGCYSTRSRCSRRSLESFPVCASRLVDVDVRVHEARHDDGFSTVVNVLA